MNNIVLQNIQMPLISACDHIVAHTPFYHINRVASFNILIYVVKGVLYVTEDNIDYEIQSGELLLLKSDVKHYGKFEIQKGTEWYFAHFYLPVCEVPSDFETVSVSLPKTVSGLFNSRLAENIVKLSDFYNSDDLKNKLSANAKLFEILTDIALYNINNIKITTLSDKICTYLYDNYNKKFSASDIEKEFFLSYKYMAFTFKKEKGVTMQQYHTKIKIETACKLLQTTLLSVGEISTAVGYNDMLYFSRCFHSYKGMSPTEYRKLMIRY